MNDCINSSIKAPQLCRNFRIVWGLKFLIFRNCSTEKPVIKWTLYFTRKGQAARGTCQDGLPQPQYGNKFRNIFNCASSQGGVERVYQFRFLCYFKSSWWIIRYYLRQGNKELIGDCSAESLHVYTKWISSSYLQGVVHITSQQLLIRDDVSKVSVTKIGETGASMIMLLARGKI